MRNREHRKNLFLGGSHRVLLPFILPHEAPLFSYMFISGRGPFQGPRVSSFLTPGNELFKDFYVLIKHEPIGKGCLDREQQGKVTQEDCSVMRLTG